MKNKKRWLLTGLIASLCLLFTFSTSAKAAEEKTYTIGTDITFAPFEFANENNEYVGIDIDLLNAIAKDQGFKVDIKPVGFDTAAQQLQAGQVDGMIAGMTITDERKKTFDFSDPYFTSGITMAVAKNNTTITSYNDLKGKTIGAKVGTESADYIEKHKEKYGYTVRLLDTADIMYQMLQSGTVDAVFDDYPVVGYAISQGQNIKTVTDRIPGGSYGFAVKKGANQDLLANFNAGLKNLKDSGEYERIVNHYIANNTKSADESTFIGILKVNYPRLLKGLGITLALAFVSFILACILGVLLGLCNVSPNKGLRFLATLYIDIFRGVPLLILASFIYVGLPSLFAGARLSLPVACVIILSLNCGAYVAEIFRGGINAVPAGQSEAARSLGLPYGRTMRKIILPQAIRIMIPSFINQFIITLKDTTILSVIGMVELMQTGKIIGSRNYEFGKVYLILAIIYIVIITTLAKVSTYIERRVNKNV